MIEAAVDDTSSSLYIVLLDWSKAFDRIRHDCLIKALHRFGVRGAILDLIGAIYRGRTFSVRDAGTESELLSQAAGIAQGCPLSPYLFIMVMTVALLDAKRIGQPQESCEFILTPEMVYADDTMLMGSSAESVQRHLDSVVQVGRMYGLELNLEKTVLLRVRGTSDIIGSDGAPLTVKSDTVYLGGVVSTTGSSDTELSRRIGEGRTGFRTLAAVWKHANITKKRKLQIFDACVVSRLLYGLDSIWLLKDQLRKLDAFYCGCLRKIANVLPAYVSRVSNRSVLEQLGAEPLSLILKRRQLILYGKLVREPTDNYTRQIAIEPGGSTPRDWRPVRRVGRPCQRWPTCVYQMGLAAYRGNASDYHRDLNAPDANLWRSIVSKLQFSTN